MPLVRIALRTGKSLAYRGAIGEAVHQAMVETIGVPPLDRFQVITEHAAGDLVYDPSYLGIERTDAVVFVQITLNAGRTTDQKRALYARVTELLTKDPGIRPQDVLINLVEVPKENWSFGSGEAQYAPRPHLE
jgi:phenylpyruvate tautomerase PptA (4-oxalocrotonate tautomerase family)